MFVAMAALELVEVGAELAVGALVCEALVVVGAELSSLPPTSALLGSRVPQLSLIVVVQFFCALASPTLARLQTSKAFSQMN